MMNISAVPKRSRGRIVGLIKNAGLPFEDITNNTELFMLKQDDRLLGAIGIEHDGNVALLRSLCVDEKHRGKGFGEALVNFLETYATEKRIRVMFLLTTTAETFFARHGYHLINRSEAPDFIQQSSEFSTVCPSTAIIMKKELQ